MSRAADARSVVNLYRFDRVASILPEPAALTEDALLRYQTEGFVAIENLLTPDEVEEAKAALSDLIHGRVAEYKTPLQPEAEFQDTWEAMSAAERADRVRKIWRFVESEPRLNTLAVSHPALQTVLEKLIGEPVHLIQDMALLKPPHIGTEKPWHQDGAYFGWRPPEKIIGVWIALDEATAENGCMHVIPGTHRAGPVPHTHDRDCQIPDDRVKVAEDVLVPLKPGGALFFSSLLHHGTPPNNSPHRRWALQYHYAATSCEPINRVQHAEMFFEDGRYQGCRGMIGQPLEDLEP
ncbi:MAG: hypothetical protein OHK0029_07990 [Armatimonadaceae bacterium]